MRLPSEQVSMSLIVVFVGIGLSSPAGAIITRHDLPDSDYVVEDSEYPAVVDLFQPGDCTGTLIHESYLLTAAHCAMGMNTGRDLQVNGVDQAVAEIILHPQWGGWLYDIALVRFEEPVVGVTPHDIYRETDEDGQQLILVGRGLHATGLEGQIGGSMDQQLRRATNIVSGVTDHWIEVYFEEPGEAGITDLEGVGAAGDSGGPAFIETKNGLVVAGLNSWGDAQPYSNVGKYGATDYSTRVSNYLDWIDGEVGKTGPGDGGGDDTGIEPTLDTGGVSDTDDGDGGGDDAGSDSADEAMSSTGCCCESPAARTPSGGWLGGMVLMLGLLRRRWAGAEPTDEG